MQRSALVFLGGGLGALLRALVGSTLAGADAVLPVSVLVINLAGALVLGAVYALADEAGLMQGETRAFLAVGVLGGFTTFSTFGWGALTLGTRGESGTALVYVALTLAGGVLAIYLGMAAGRESVNALERLALGLLRRLNERGRRRHRHIAVDLSHNDREGRE